MAYIHECDMCGTRFENGFLMNVVSFFERNQNPIEVESEEKYGIQFKVNKVPLKEANPRLELCDECFDLLKAIVGAFANLGIDDALKLEFKKENDEEA